jgi:hypothetical protein
MDEEGLPEDVLRFIVDRIDSVPQLEALLLMWESAGKRWTEEEIAARVYVGGDTARGVLQGLTQRRLLRLEGSSRYVYDPAWDETGQLMPKVAETYRRQLVKVAKAIHAKASPSVQEFARAFQLKKDG